MKIIRSTLKHTPDKGETPKGVSLTVPDDSYTIQELLARHEAGLGFGIQRLGNFDLDDDEEHDAIDMNQYQNMDITEKEALHREMKGIKDEAETTLKARKKAKEKEATKEEIKD
jgi:hypothetical protein